MANSIDNFLISTFNHWSTSSLSTNWLASWKNCSSKWNFSIKDSLEGTIIAVKYSLLSPIKNIWSINDNFVSGKIHYILDILDLEESN